MSNYHQKVIAVDLDGTLAFYDSWRGPLIIGAPIKRMVDRVKEWIAAGHKVVIFTARISWDSSDEIDPARVLAVRQWLIDAGLPNLEITNIKRKEFAEIWDDRAKEVVPNTGIRLFSEASEPLHLQ